jgi:hypothetical protein
MRESERGRGERAVGESGASIHTAKSNERVSETEREGEERMTTVTKKREGERDRERASERESF